MSLDSLSKKQLKKKFKKIKSIKPPEQNSGLKFGISQSPQSGGLFLNYPVFCLRSDNMPAGALSSLAKIKKQFFIRIKTKKWLAGFFVLAFFFSCIGFINFSRAQEAATVDLPGESNASSAPAVLPAPELTESSQTENASSSDPFNIVSSTQELNSALPETNKGISLLNASSTDLLTNNSNQNASSSLANSCGNGVIDAGEQCDDANLVDNDGCNSTCKKEVIVPDDVGTGMDLNFGGNERPVIKAIWAANQADLSQNQGLDDSLASGAQFMPSGQYQVDKKISVCAVVSDPDGLADLDSVNSEIYYPKDIYLGPNRPSSQPGCGQPKAERIEMNALATSAGLDLFCQQIRTKNTNLPSFKTGSDFDTLCGSAGDLTSGASLVYCGQSQLSYQDPSGDYRLKALAFDKNGDSGSLENSFKYLELVAFEIDFENIDYGSMKLNSPKTLTGNDVFVVNDGRPTLRNVGNTRLEISIKQNDMNLGKSEIGWNILYKSRVGADADFTSYWPEAWTNLANSINLGQASPLDLAIEVLKFPESSLVAHYAGKLSLNATAAPHLVCSQ